MSKRLLGIGVAALLLVLGACQSVPTARVEALPDYEALFTRSQGWIGADAIYSVALAPAQTIWLFGDTFWGRVADGRRHDALLVNNTVAVQTGRSPPHADMSFYAGRQADGEPSALIRPADGKGWFWIYDGIQTGSGLYLFLVQIERSKDPSVFGFRLVGNWLGHIANPQDSPDRWQITQRRLPWTGGSGLNPILFGSAVLAVGNDLYIYGARDRTSGSQLQKDMLVARVPIGQLADFDLWRFYAGDHWANTIEEAASACEEVANEYSVSYLPRLKKYVLVYSEGGLSPNILARLAGAPTGPWSAPIQLYRCPEADWDSRIFCYAGKGHPEISDRPGELIVTYVSNATELELLEADARLYRPRFIRVTFEK